MIRSVTCALLLLGACHRAGPTTVRITAAESAFTPATITLHKGVAVILELTARDRHHGFNVPALGLRAEIAPGSPARLPLIPRQAGTFPFHCDVFCGDGHEEMTGQIIVLP